MQPTTTRVDVVVPALLAAFTAALPTFQILDGPRAAQDLADDVLQVGIGNDDHSESYSSETELQPGLSGRLLETITVNCEMTTWTGDPDVGIAALRTRLTAAIAAIDTRFRTDQQLAGTCDRIHLGPRARWYALQADTGPGAGVEFAVIAQAYL